LTFPNLKNEGYQVTSPPESYYNCIAWAAGDPDRYWSPIPRDQSDSGYAGQYEEYWPGVKQENTVESWMDALAKIGFEACSAANPESGIQKIAIYTDDQGEPQHVARQLPNGGWTSKLGDDCDIEHKTLTALEGEQYGHARFFMKRPAHIELIRG
jgi:hypothetical protein